MSTPKRPRGFAALSPERRSEIGRMGGLAQPKGARSFEKDRDLAASAGRKGGANGRRKKDDGDA